MFSTLNVSFSVATILEMASSDAATRWKPPAIKWILGFIVAAASTILSIPGWEQPTTSTTPSGVLMASDSSLSSRVPGASDTRAIRVMPGMISVVLSVSSKLAPSRFLYTYLAYCQAALSQAINDDLLANGRKVVPLLAHFFERLDKDQCSCPGLNCLGRKMATKSPRSWNAMESSEYVACNRAEARALSQLALDIGNEREK